MSYRVFNCPYHPPTDKDPLPGVICGRRPSPTACQYCGHNPEEAARRLALLHTDGLFKGPNGTYRLIIRRTEKGAKNGL